MDEFEGFDIESINIQRKNRSQRMSIREREIIEYLLKKDFSGARIAKFLDRSTNPVNVEIRRNGGRKNYSAKSAQKESDIRWDNKKALFCNSINARNDEFLNLIEEKNSPIIIQKKMKISSLSLINLYKKNGLNTPKVYDLLNEILDKIYALEQQINILFEMMEK